MMYKSYPDIYKSNNLKSFKILDYDINLLTNIESESKINFHYVLTIYKDKEIVMFIYSGWTNYFASEKKPCLGAAIGQTHFYHGCSVSWKYKGHFLQRAIKIFMESFDIKIKISNEIKEKIIDYFLEDYSEFLKNYFDDICNFYYPVHLDFNKFKYQKQDEELTQLWINPSIKIDSEDYEKEKRKMLSARYAEKASMTFYKNIKYNVDDISITQLKEGEENWKIFDILLNNKIPANTSNDTARIITLALLSFFCKVGFSILFPGFAFANKNGDGNSGYNPKNNYG